MSRANVGAREIVQAWGRILGGYGQCIADIHATQRVDRSQGAHQLPRQSLPGGLEFGLVEDPRGDGGALDERHQHAGGAEAPVGGLERKRLWNRNARAPRSRDQGELVLDRDQ